MKGFTATWVLPLAMTTLGFIDQRVIPDEAALYEIISRLRDLGLKLT